MDSRRTIYALIASVAVFYLYMMVVSRLMPPPKPTTQPAATQSGTSRPAAAEPGPGSAQTHPASASQPAAAIESQPTTEAAAQQQLIVEGGQDRAAITLGNAEKGNAFPMALQIMPRGATVASAELRDHYLTVERKQPYVVFSPMSLPDEAGRLETFYSFATPRIRFENRKLEADLEHVDWAVVERSKQQVVFSATIKTPAGETLARVLKTYRLAPQPAMPHNKAQTCDLGLTLTIENLSGKELDVILTQQGPVDFRKEDPRREDRRVIVARWQKGQFKSKGEYRTEVIKNAAKIAAKDDDAEQERIAWAAETNKYFACIMAPAGRNQPQCPPLFASVEPSALREKDTGHQEDLTFRFITVPMAIKADQSREVGFDCYIGPKSKAAFDAVKIYQQRNYYNVISESFYICAPGALVALMMYLLDLFYKIPPHNYGIAIIILVLLVRLLLHPLTKKSQVNMMKVQQQQAGLKPKLDAIKQKYANDKVKLNQATMDLYREEGINPAGSILSCLPMLLQLPIWGALWTALASMIEMRHAAFDPWWIRDLAGPDAVYVLSRPFDIPLIGYLMGGPIDSINVLPILLAISQMLQAMFMPKTQTPQPTEGAPDQRKMMMFMSFLFMFMLWNAPSGLNLYIMASNFFGIAEQQRIRKHIKELEARRPEMEAQRREKAQQRKQSWLYRKWHDLAREADDARKIKSDRDKSKSSHDKKR